MEFYLPLLIGSDYFIKLLRVREECVHRRLDEANCKKHTKPRFNSKHNV